MEPGDKNWAQGYLNDPLTAPQPSQETGPGTHFRPDSSAASSVFPTSPTTHAQNASSKLAKRDPSYRKSVGSATTTNVQRSSSARDNSYPTPPASASPHGPNSPSYRQDAFNESRGTRPRRSSSLTAKYAGDVSHRPLDTLTKEKRTADRSRHATRKHHIRPDSIDKLDEVGASYHHGGPYDATLFARNNSKDSPLQALAGTNAEALRATPHEKVIDSVRSHRPLDGTASYAPGQMDRNGHVYEYQAGENMMTDLGGNYKRWPGVQYHPDDFKGKGEPSYSIEKALKEHSLDEKPGVDGIEMKSQHRHRSGSGAIREAVYDDGAEGMVGRSGSLGRGIRKRIGGLRKNGHKDEPGNS